MQRVEVEETTPETAINIILVIGLDGIATESINGFMRTINTRLEDLGIGSNSSCLNNYAIVGLTRETTLYRGGNGSSTFNFTEFDALFNKTRANTRSQNGDGYLGITFAVTEVHFTASTLICERSQHMILVTGTDRFLVNPNITQQVVYDLLAAEDITLHAIIYSGFIVDGRTGLGRSVDLGYAASDDPCFSAHPDVRDGTSIGNTQEQYTKLALAVNGTAWDITQLNIEGQRKAISCALADIIAPPQPPPIEFCSVCSCEEDGYERCRTNLTAAGQRQCLCGNITGMVSVRPLLLVLLIACYFCVRFRVCRYSIHFGVFVI